tara:strand:+ start:329 stop:1561 length:1233 start_codon:yes stop_codon:yes gene_type:complete
MSNNLAVISSKEILGTMDNCTKCGICYSFCPVANVTNEFPGPKYTGPQTQRFRMIESLEELSPDLCNGCGICTSVCPNQVAITDIITLAKSNLKNKNKKISFLQKILNRPDKVGTIGNYIPFLSNLILHSFIFRFIAEKLLGLDRNAPMPRFSGGKFKKFISKIKFKKNRPNIFYFSGCSVDHYDYEAGISAVKVLDILGYNVITETGLCCSLPMLSSGEFDKAKNRSKKIIVNLEKKLNKVKNIVSTSTSCSLTLRKKYSEYLDFTDQDSLKVSSSVKDICEYMLENHFDFFSRNLHSINIKKVFYHGPCQLKSHSMGLPALEIMRLIPNLKIVLSEADCCGIGGTYGYSKEKSHISSSIKKNIIQQIKNEKPDLIICDSETCRWNIEKSTKIKTIHPIQLILNSLNKN